MWVNSEAFVSEIRSTIASVASSEIAGVRKAAELVAAALRRGGLIQAFGTGHSEAFAMEIAGRAGGLVPTNRLALRDLVIFGDAEPQEVLDVELERRPETAHRLYQLGNVDPADVFLIASNSGINGAVVELALLAKERGHRVVAIVSAAHSAKTESRHPSGRKLGEIADVVLDNGAPYGDAVLPLPDQGSVCGVSSITAAVLGQMLVAEVIGLLLDEGDAPPVYLSANIPEGDEHNHALEARYAGRIRRSA